MSNLTTGGSSQLPDGWSAHAPWGKFEYFFWHKRVPATDQDIRDLVSFVRKPFFVGGAMSGFSHDGFTEGNPPIHKGSLEGRGWNYKDDQEDDGPVEPKFV